ncbi:hypothetical protein ACH95_00280 [Bacillus glycinifermentans]|uniref:Uncharacterized protein n=1 Tax=Bacillus glycinifermentans TaxID=1664069 RepID=A0A0J6EJ97_9BACI|nr:hypothetical protein COP00_21970 [Bacillus glycinifermentans]KMM63560.1 hypothetical protein ACH95_00280 [Bacillus glycinifermentans]KRT94507.1 hypothetical protein AB447_214740 [Bacillus glycinifermentans]
MSRSSFVHAPFLCQKGMLHNRRVFFFGEKTFRLPTRGASVFLIDEKPAENGQIFEYFKRRNGLCQM